MRSLIAALSFLTACLSSGPPAATAAAPVAPQPVQAVDGSWSIQEPAYRATIDPQGYLSSVTYNGVALLGAPFEYQPQAKLVADHFTAAGPVLQVHLKGSGEAEIDYEFSPTGITVTTNWKGTGYASFRFTASDRLLGIELLNNKSPVGGGEATSFVDHGEIRGVPAVPSSSNQMVRFHFPGVNLGALVQTWGAPFNFESAGEIRDRSWGRPLLGANHPFPIVFQFERVAGPRLLRAPVFVPRTIQVASLYYTDDPCIWNIDLGTPDSYRYLLDAGIQELTVRWSLTDIDHRPAGTGSQVIHLNLHPYTTLTPVTLHPPGAGYYDVLFTLSAAPLRSGLSMLESSFQTRFTVIHRIAGMINRDNSFQEKPVSDTAVMAMIGAGAIRESHNVGEFFSSQPQSGPDWEKLPDAPVWMNRNALNSLFDRASAESRRYQVPWFFQANSRPAYATPAVYEAMAFALVSLGKDRCSTWEVENEPNFSYSPADYVTKALVPFARGAKRADPACTVMGPACVSLKQTLEFMEAIYAAGANRWLDAVSTHTYPGPGESWEQFGNTATIPELRRWMVEHGDGQKPIWQTEQGYAWDNAPKAQAARYTVRQFLEGARLGIPLDHQYYFYPQWHGFEDWYLSGGGEAGSEQSWLPSGAALRFLAENLYGKRFARDEPAPYKGIFLSRFTGLDEDVIAAWTFDFPYVLRARVPGLEKIMDFSGNLMPLHQDRAGNLVVPISGEPVYLHLRRGTPVTAAGAWGANVAAASTGAVATASSETPGKPAANAIDGNWQLWETVPGLPGRTAWQSAKMDPSMQAPDWLEVRFPAPRTINRIAALCYLPAVSASPRDFRFEAEVNGKWKTVGAGQNEFTWCFVREFPTVRAQAIRMVMSAINDGWLADRRSLPILLGPGATHYTDSKVLVSELEAYGPGL